MTTLVAQLLCVAPAAAQDAFDAGRKRISIAASSGTGSGGSYFVLGLGGGYFLRDGLELGLDVETRLGGRNDVHEVSPSLTYVLTQFHSFVPYAGLLYRRTYIEGLENLSAYGARGGLFLQQSSRVQVRAGVAALVYEDCNNAIHSDCTEFFPEVSAAFMF